MVRRRTSSGPVSTASVRLAGSELICPCHVCAFYNGADEQYAWLLPFLTEGLRAGERVVTISGTDERAERIERLRRAGIDVASAQRSGQLEIQTWDDVYLTDGRFNADEMVGVVQETINTGRHRGFPRTRGWGNMEWALTGAPGVEQLAVYESRINYILPLYNDASVCAYDVTRFPASVLEDVARAHPYVLADGFVQENPLYTPPDELVPELESRKH